MKCEEKCEKTTSKWLAFSIIATLALFLTGAVAFAQGPDQNGGAAGQGPGPSATSPQDPDDIRRGEGQLGDATPAEQNQNRATNQGEDQQLQEQESTGPGEPMLISTQGEGNGNKPEAAPGQAKSAEHRSAVATFVQQLRATAQRDGGIGEEVRAIAQEQEQRIGETEGAMNAIQTRAKWKTFLFGSDYKNVGTIRSTIRTTESHMARLEEQKYKTADPAIQAELDTEIAALRAENEKVLAFVTEHESQFSVLGWLFRLFDDGSAAPEAPAENPETPETPEE